jgi:GNAT superfamily N-acetyltransferase
MHVDWLDPNSLDRRDIDAATALIEVARAADRPGDLAYSARRVASGLKYGWDLNPPQTALARDTRGRVVGLLGMNSSTWDNQHAADIEVTVDPSARRRGLGAELFEAGVARAVADGRTLVTAASWEGSPGMAFAKAMGLDRASEEVKRAQDLWSLDWARLDALSADAATQHADYEIVPIGYPTPEGLLAAISEMAAAINDAPIDDLDIEDEVFTPERLRAFEKAQLARDRRLHRLVARHRPTGELAGQTILAVEALQPWHAHQLDTSVLRAHRGHRLGLALKIAMLRQLAEREPQVRTLETWNAASNDHMIAVNEALGYRPVGRAIDWQKHL